MAKSRVNIDILDLIRIRVVPMNNGQVNVNLEPLDLTKQVVVDEKALGVLNERITHIAKEKQLSTRDKNAMTFLEEYTGRMLSELYRNGLADLQDLPEASDDPYAAVRYKYNKRT